MGSYSFAIGIIESLQLHDVGVSDNSHDLKFTILAQVNNLPFSTPDLRLTLNLLSCKTRLMAASSPDGESLVWKTTPNEPFPTILHCVYCMSLCSPVMPSETFSRITSVKACIVSDSTSLVGIDGEISHLPFSGLRTPVDSAT